MLQRGTFYAFHRKGRVSVAMKVLQSGRVAVARCFTAPEDKFQLDFGLNKVLARLHSFYENYRKNWRNTRYATVYRRGNQATEAHVLFEVLDPKKLQGQEKEFFNRHLKQA